MMCGTSGSLPRSLDERSRTLLAIAVLGSLHAWDKASLGDRVVWIGAQLSVEDFGISMAIPKDKLDALHSQTTRFLSATVAQKQDLLSFCGKLSFVAGVVPMLRPFVDMVSGALASSSGLPLELVQCRRLRMAVQTAGVWCCQ